MIRAEATLALTAALASDGDLVHMPLSAISEHCVDIDQARHASQDVLVGVESDQPLTSKTSGDHAVANANVV